MHQFIVNGSIAGKAAKIQVSAVDAGEAGKIATHEHGFTEIMFILRITKNTLQQFAQI